jgi:hypothetical protein
MADSKIYDSMVKGNKKQGACGKFCFKYWLLDGCPDDCVIDYRDNKI